MDDKLILHRITEMADEEHRLRTRRLAGEISSDDESARLQTLEESLDQCWDLLRRRRAARAAGINPAEVAPSPAEQVEGYLQ